MTPKEYSQRHGRVGQYFNWKICQYYNATFAKNWYQHRPEKVVETESAIVLWDFYIHSYIQNKTIK